MLPSRKQYKHVATEKNKGLGSDSLISTDQSAILQVSVNFDRDLIDFSPSYVSRIVGTVDKEGGTESSAADVA